MWSQVLDRNSRRGMSALDSAQVIRCRNTLPKWTADTSKISSQNPIIHRASPILQLAHAVCGFAQTLRCLLHFRCGLRTLFSSFLCSNGTNVIEGDLFVLRPGFE